MSVFDAWYTKDSGLRVSKTYLDTWQGRRKMASDFEGATAFGWDVVKHDVVAGHANVGTIALYALIGLTLIFTIIVPIIMVMLMNTARTKSRYFVVFVRSTPAASPCGSPTANSRYTASSPAAVGTPTNVSVRKAAGSERPREQQTSLRPPTSLRRQWPFLLCSAFVLVALVATTAKFVVVGYAWAGGITLAGFGAGPALWLFQRRRVRERTAVLTGVALGIAMVALGAGLTGTVDVVSDETSTGIERSSLAAPSETGVPSGGDTLTMRVCSEQTINLRSGPSATSPALYLVRNGTLVAVRPQEPDGWHRVVDGKGWLPASSLRAQEDECPGLPTATDSASLPITPTDTPPGEADKNTQAGQTASELVYNTTWSAGVLAIRKEFLKLALLATAIRFDSPTWQADWGLTTTVIIQQASALRDAGPPSPKYATFQVSEQAAMNSIIDAAVVLQESATAQSIETYRRGAAMVDDAAALLAKAETQLPK